MRSSRRVFIMLVLLLVVDCVIPAVEVCGTWVVELILGPVDSRLLETEV